MVKEKKSIPKVITSIAGISTLVGLVVVLMDFRFFAHEPNIKNSKFILSLEDSADVYPRLIDWTYNLPYASNYFAIFFSHSIDQQNSSIFFQQAIAQMSYKGRVFDSTSMGYDQRDPLEKNQIISLSYMQFNKLDSLRILYKYICKTNPTDTITIYLYHNNFLYSIRSIFVKTVYFFTSLATIWFYIHIRTSKYRIVAGLVLSIYSVFATEPFSAFIPGFVPSMFNTITRNCVVSIVIFYALFIRGKTHWLDYASAGSIALTLFGITTVYSCELIALRYNDGPDVLYQTPLKTLFKIVLCIAIVYGFANRVIRDRQYINYYLLIVACGAAATNFMSAEQLDGTIWFSITYALIHIFVYTLPTLFRARAHPSSITINSLAPVKQAVALSDEEYDSDESYIVTEAEDSEYDDEYDADEDDDDEYEDEDEDDESDSAPPVKGIRKFVASRRKVSDDDDDDDDDDD